MLLAMSSVPPSLHNIDHSTTSHTSSPSSRSRASSLLSPSVAWSNRSQGIRKNTHAQTNSPANSAGRNFESLLPEQILQSCNPSPASAYSSIYSSSPRLSPQAQSLFDSVESDPAIAWSMPTPPRSESGSTSRSSATAGGSYPVTSATGASGVSFTRPSMRCVISARYSMT